MNKYVRRTIKKGWECGLESGFDFIAVPVDKLAHTLMVVYRPDKEKPPIGYMIVGKTTKRFKPHVQRGSQGMPDQKMVYVRWIPYVKKEEVSMQEAIIKSGITLEKLRAMRPSNL